MSSKTKDQIYALWKDQDECPDFFPVLEILLDERDRMIEALKIYGDRKNWSDQIMRQGRLVFMPKNVISVNGPEIAERALA